jgi:hypothetical protein
MSRDGTNPFLDKLILICSENIAFSAGLPGPDQVSADAAALMHGAYDRVSRLCDINQVINLVQSALENISVRNDGVDLNELAIQYSANLRHHFGLARKVPRWLVPFVLFARTVPLPRFVSNAARNWIAR